MVISRFSKLLGSPIGSRIENRIRRIIHGRTRADPGLTGKFIPLGRGNQPIILEKHEGKQPVPPPQLWENYGSDAAEYLGGGQQDVDTMLRILGTEVAAELGTVLDLGCAAGRMLRHLPRHRESEYWGVDISAAHIRWCQEHLQALNFATITTAPHLPFADDYFDLVYAASVFTHISDLADAWLLEVRRVLKPGGRAYLTLHDLKSFELLVTPSTYSAEPSLAEFVEESADFERRESVRGRSIDAFWFGTDPQSQVFYDSDYLKRKWGKWMRVAAYHPQIHNYQSALLLEKV
jgi:SAM-dependent methyltransferase